MKLKFCTFDSVKTQMRYFYHWFKYVNSSLQTTKKVDTDYWSFFVSKVVQYFEIVFRFIPWLKVRIMIFRAYTNSPGFIQQNFSFVFLSAKYSQQFKHSRIPSLSRKNLSQSASYVNKLYHSSVSRIWLGIVLNSHKLKKHCLLLQIQHADYFGCSARPACSGFLVFSCLFTPKWVQDYLTKSW